VDKALDSMVAWVRKMAKKFLDALLGKNKKGKDGKDDKKPDPAEVIRRVKSDLKGRSQKLDSAAAFKAMIGAVAQSQAGLKSIRVRGAGEGSWNIEASASPYSLVGVVNEFVKTDYGSVVATVAIDDVVFGAPVKNKGKEHAEDKIIGLVQSRLTFLAKSGKPSPSKIEIFVSQSPCKTKCAPNLGQLKGQYPQVKLWLIYYKTLYQGTSGKHSEDSQEAIELLQKSGFHVLQWNEALDMEKAGTLPK
jgi:hypothetical protein